MRALVIGASSFSGQYMCRELLDAGYKVVGTWLHDPLVKKDSEICWERMDLLKPDMIDVVLSRYRPECIYNFATQSSVGRAWEDPGTTVEINVNGILNLFEGIRRSGDTPTVVLIGAGEEYGRVSFKQVPIPETAIPHPANVYAASMACQTMMARIYHKAYGLKLIVARTFNVLGPGQTDKFAVPNFCRQIANIELGLSTREIHVGNINICRDFTDIRDLVRAYRLLAEKGVPGEVYNVGRGKAIKIRDILEYMNRRMDGSLKIIVDRERIRPVDIPTLVGDVAKLQNDTGWKPTISLEQTIEDMIRHWRTQLENRS